jgi:hypothetical protein
MPIAAKVYIGKNGERKGENLRPKTENRNTRSVPASMILRRHQNQPRPSLHSTRPGSPNASLQNANHGNISGNHSHGNGSYDGRAKNKRHE